MKLVRIDQLAPGGTALELHPRATVLLDASPEVRRRLTAVFDSLAGDAAPGAVGLIEVSGVRLALDRATLDQLRLDPELEPVLRLGSGSGAEVAAGGPGDARPLRDALREVTAQRTELAERMAEVRSLLDPFAASALEVAVGRIDALESQRTSLRTEWERERATQRRRRDELAARVAHDRRMLERAETLDPSIVAAARDALVRALEPPTELDPAAVELADQLDAAMSEVRELAARRATLELREREASQRLDDANDEARSAERSMRAPVYDAQIVARLEQVRDEIFSVDDRQGRIGAARNKRKLSELRAEEAILLDRLGFDTYSSYVMGIPSVRAELERSHRLESAQDRTDRIAEEIDQLRADAPDATSVDRAVRSLHRLLTRCLEYLGDPRAPSSELSSPDRAGVDPDTADLVYETIAELRRRRLTALPESSPQVALAADRLHRAMADQHDAWPEEARSDETRRESLPERGTPTVLIGQADRWLEQHRRLSDHLDGVRQRVRSATVELESLDGAHEPAPDVTRWAEVEAGLDAALDQLSVAEDRVRAHESATAALAARRDEELALRERERELLARIAATERPGTGAVTTAAAPTKALTPPPYRPPTDRSPTEAAPTDPPPTPAAPTVDDDPADPGVGDHWTLVAQLAEHLSVSFAGSVPLLVDGLPDGDEAASEVLDRIAAMSDMVQVVLLAPRDQMPRVQSRLGAAAAVHVY